MGYVVVISLPLLFLIIGVVAYLVRSRALRQRAEMNHRTPVVQPPPFQGHSPNGAIYHATSIPPPPLQDHFSSGAVYHGTPVQPPPFQGHFQGGPIYHGASAPPPPPFQGHYPDGRKSSQV